MVIKKLVVFIRKKNLCIFKFFFVYTFVGFYIKFGECYFKNKIFKKNTFKNKNKCYNSNRIGVI